MDSFGKKSSTKRGKCRLSILLLLAAFAPQFMVAQNVDKKYQRFFFKYSKDERSLLQAFLNDAGLPPNYSVGRSFAVVAGVSQYPNMSASACDGQGGNLNPAAIDVRKVRTYLAEYEKFDEIIVLENNDVTLETLQYFLQEYLGEKIENYPRSRFLFAYSGHGTNSNNNGYLLKSTARSCTDNIRSIHLDILHRLIDEVVRSAHHSLVLINSCYGGKFLAFGETPRSTVLPLPLHPGAHAITAGSDGELTLASSSESGSIFFEKIFAGLDGRANREASFITTSELHLYLVNQIRMETNQRQNPKMGDIYPDGSKGEFFFINRDKFDNKLPPWTSEYWRNWISFGDTLVIDEAPTPKRKFTIVTKTGRHEDAGTDDLVRITFKGKNGSSRAYNLLHKGNDRKIDRVDVYGLTIEEQDIGDLESVSLQMVNINHGGLDDWQINEIVIIDQAKGREFKKTFQNEWLGDENGPSILNYELEGWRSQD